MTEKFDKCGIEALLKKLTEEDKPLMQTNEKDFECTGQYSLLRGFQIMFPAKEREKLIQWKEMAKNVETNIMNRKNERYVTLREEIRKAELKIQKNRSEKSNMKNNNSFNGNMSSNSNTDNQLPYIYKFESRNKQPRINEGQVNGVLKGPTTVSHCEDILDSEDISCVDYMPALKKHMESLQVVQFRQKELDVWYADMQKQLEIEKVRLTEKYEELQLKNIREQQSIIESSHEYLRSASNNNTPSLVNANCKQQVNVKSCRTQGSFKLAKDSLCIDNSPPIIQSSSLPTFKSPARNNVPLESECLISDKNSAEYCTPCASPGKNVNKQPMAEIVRENGINDNHAMVNDENIVITSPSVCSSKIVNEGLNQIHCDVPEDVNNVTYQVDKSPKSVDVVNSIPLVDGFSKLNCGEDNEMTKRNPVSPVKHNEESVPGGEVKRNEINSSISSENCPYFPPKSTIPKELKSLISVPSRRTSTDTVDSLELGRSSIEQLMKQHNHESLESRRKSRPIKFFSNPFPTEPISHGDYDEEVCSSTNTHQIITHSPISSVVQQQLHHLPEEQNHSGCPDEVFDSPRIPDMSPQHSANTVKTQLKLEKDSNVEKKDIVPQGISTSANNPDCAVSNSDSVSVMSSFHDHCTSTPETFLQKHGVGLLLEISAVTLPQMGEEKKSPTFNRSMCPDQRIADKLCAIAKGFLTRKLLKTLKVQEIIKTIQDTEEFLNDIDKENINSQKLADWQLRVRLQDELSTKRAKLHDIFFNMDARDQMKMLAISRAQVEEKHRKKQAQMKSSRSNHNFSRGFSTSSPSKNLSTASQKSLKRRQTTNSEKVPKTKSAVSEKGMSTKKINNRIESTGANIHVCIAGALKPIQSCTSPTMADRKKAKSPVKTNSVQNRYTKKSSVSKRLDMNAAGGTTQSARFKSSGGLSSR